MKDASNINGLFNRIPRIFPSRNKPEKQLSDSVIDHKTDIERTTGTYKCENDDVYKVIGIKSGDNANCETTTETGSSDNSPSSAQDEQKLKQEKWWQITIQVSIPFLLAGVGTIGAGIILGQVEQLAVFDEIRELFILVPALLGLKGNLDMTLAARLSTQANIGNMKSRKEIVHMVVGNIALVQVQAVVASFIVSIFSLSVGFAFSGEFFWSHAFLLTASAMVTATVSCFVLDFVLVALILVAHKYKANPDNIATPLAASIGDLVSITSLALITTFLFLHIDSDLWITYVIISFYFAILPFWIAVVWRNRYTKPVLKSGWIPVLSALFISGSGGIVLKRAVTNFNGFVVFQPIINGIGGNLVSVQASRMSTTLYQVSPPGTLPSFGRIFENPFRSLISGTPYAQSARILLSISIPGQIIFIFVADLIHMRQSTIGAPFVFTYLTASLLQITLLLLIAHTMIHAMWKFKIDPDSSAIPFLTAFGDLFGSLLLLGAFTFLRAVGHEYNPNDIDGVLGLKKFLYL